ncbi:MAG: hypothetical protein PHF84_01775 [bacterium]|nr:hypothetical protein [bacterium]
MILVLLAAGCGDSLKSRLTSRLNNFRNAVPEEIRTRFDKGEYQEAGRLLDEKIKAVQRYISLLNTEEKKRFFIRGQYEPIQADIKKLGIPKNILDFNRNFWSVQDYECIPTFTGSQVVDYFKVYFKEKLDTMK